LLADLSGAMNNIIGKIKRGGYRLDHCFCSCLVPVKESMESPDSFLDISAPHAANKFRLTQTKVTTSL
jgi:hypothetical protein